MAHPSGALPVTLLGSLTAGQRDDVLRCLLLRRPETVAVVYVMSPGEDGVRLDRRVVDARGVHDDARVDLVGCCLSCTLRTDAGEALDLVVGADRWSEVVLCPPAPVPLAALATALGGRPDVRVDTLSVVVDAASLVSTLSGDDLLVEQGLAAAPTDRRSIAELLVELLESADVLAVAGLHQVPTEQARAAEALLAHLSPLALQVPLGPGGAGADDLAGTGRHDPTGTRASREQLAVLAAELCAPACGVATVLWQADRALHPGRLADALRDLLSGVVRSRGSIALLGRPGRVVRWESAGGSLAFGDPVADGGSASCSLVLTGTGLDPDRLRALLDSCLVTADELPRAVVEDDPFAAALGPAEQPDAV